MLTREFGRLNRPMNTQPVSKHRRRQRGSVIVETALSFLVFALIFIGIFDFGQFLYIHQALVERVRYAARWGAINDATNHTAIQNMILYYQSATPVDGTPTYFNLTSGNLTITDPGVNTDNYYLKIIVSGYQFTALSPYFSSSMTGPAITVSVPLGMYN